MGNYLLTDGVRYDFEVCFACPVGFCEISKATSHFDREDVLDKVSALSILPLSFKMEENIKYQE